MANDKLDKISQDEALIEEFVINMNEQIASDDEVPRKKFSALKDAYENCPSVVDDVVMALCGWSVETLCDQTITKCKTK